MCVFFRSVVQHSFIHRLFYEFFANAEDPERAVCVYFVLFVPHSALSLSILVVFKRDSMEPKVFVSPEIYTNNVQNPRKTPC